MAEVALISIHSKYADRIYEGIKCFEFRSIMPKKSIDYLLLYETKPVGAITGLAKVLGAIEGSPEEVWEKTKRGAGISKSYFMSYYRGKKRAVAICLGSPLSFKREIPLSKFKLSKAPQSFQYVDVELDEIISNR